MKLFFIEIFAAIVKCIPSLALRFTKKTNHYNDLFLLPFKKEIYHLSRMSKEEVAKRIWSDEARVYALSTRSFYVYFASEICNAKEFNALYDNEVLSKVGKQDLITKLIEKNAYTLTNEQAKKVCLELDCVKALYQYQFPKFRIELVKEFNNDKLSILLDVAIEIGNIKECLDRNVITYLIRLYKYEEESLSKKIDDFALSLLRKNYQFNTAQAEILYKHARGILQSWINNNADAQLVFGVLRQFSDSVWRKDILQHLYKNCRNDGKHDIMAQIIPFVWNNADGNYDLVKLLRYLILSMMHPCPNLFALIRGIENTELYQANFDLCNKYNLLDKIDKTETEEFKEENREIYLLAMAEKEMLTDEEFKSVTDKTLKTTLISVLEDNAQVAWIKQLIYDYGKCGLTQDNIDNLCTQNLCYKTLILLLEERPSWIDYYHSTHCLSSAVFEKAIRDTAYASIITRQIAKYGISKSGYEALLLSPNKALAVFAKEHLA